jgi:hypothetical protein
MFEISTLIMSSYDFNVRDISISSELMRLLHLKYKVSNERDEQQNSASQKIRSLNLPQRKTAGRKRRRPVGKKCGNKKNCDESFP